MRLKKREDVVVACSFAFHWVRERDFQELLPGNLCLDEATQCGGVQTARCYGLIAGSSVVQFGDRCYLFSVFRYAFELRHQRLATLSSASLPRNPLADVCCTILQCDAIRFAALKKPDGLLTCQS
jgi:hypothetical protein